MIRATVDANVLISHLLNPTGHKPPNRIVRAAVAQTFHLILVETTLTELKNSVQNKPYLATRISTNSMTLLEGALRAAVSVIPESIDRIPTLTRDPNDDYLIAHAILEHADYLVSGDQDLLVLGEFEGVRIVSPAEFAALLDQV